MRAPHDGKAISKRAKQATAGAHCLPLEGVRVIDFGQVVSVPFGTQLLGWMGAEVILIETGTRLLSRGNPPFAYGKESPNTSGAFNLVGTGKRSVTLNLKDPLGVAVAKTLVSTADVVAENFTTGTMEALGLGYEQLRQVRPDIVMLSLGGLGRVGPMARYASFHSGANMASGLATITGNGPNDRPRIMGSYLPDPLGGTLSCLAIVEALYHRQSTGEGQYIDFSMSDMLTHMMPEAIFDYAVNGRLPAFQGNRDRLNAPQGVYRCKGKDNWVAISVTNEQEWRGLCRALGKPALATDPRFITSKSRLANHDDLDAELGRWARSRSREEATQLLQRAGVPAGPSFTAKDLLNDPHLRARDFILSIPHPAAGRRRMLGVPWRIDGARRLKVSRAPLLGEHTDEILREILGLSAAALDELNEKKVTS